MEACKKLVTHSVRRAFSFVRSARYRGHALAGFMTCLVALSLLPLTFVVPTRAPLSFSPANQFAIPAMIDQLANSSVGVTIVPDDYPTVSSAVENVSEGSTIFVRNGIYYENPVITKALTIMGEDNIGTIIVGSGG